MKAADDFHGPFRKGEGAAQESPALPTMNFESAFYRLPIAGEFV